MANRQVLTSVRCGFSSSSTLSSRSRLVHSSAPSQAAALQATASQSMMEPEEIIIAPIFDIFDVPSRLGQNTELIRSTTYTQRRPQEAEVPVKFDSSLPRPPPSTLPAPIIFDGPARPRNLPLAFQRRVEQALRSAPASTRQTRRHHTPSVSSNASEPLIEMFEGPARITRYSHRSSSQHGKNGNQLLFLGLASAVGGAALLTNDNFPILPSSFISKR